MCSLLANHSGVWHSSQPGQAFSTQSHGKYSKHTLLLLFLLDVHAPVDVSSVQVNQATDCAGRMTIAFAQLESMLALPLEVNSCTDLLFAARAHTVQSISGQNVADVVEVAVNGAVAVRSPNLAIGHVGA
eukprot:3262737-Rhodomonas_salina.1